MLLALQATFNFTNKAQGIQMQHRDELIETNLMKPKKKFKQVQVKQHDESSNVDLPLGIKNQTKLNQKIEELVKRETFKYVSFGW
jgi:hypothetical protein